jgi:multimeric flavodoxin WrbA
MTKVLVLYYSSYDRTEALAQAVVEGARFQGQHLAQLAFRLAYPL